MQEKTIHKTFIVGVYLKGIDGLLEIIGGLVFYLIDPNRWHKLAIVLTQAELLEDPRDIMANYWLRLTENISGNIHLFGSIYLISHGLIKMVLIVGLLQRRRWAYPTAILVFSFFALYQIYLYLNKPSISLLLLTIIDLIVIWLTYHEYQRLKKHYLK